MRIRQLRNATVVLSLGPHRLLVDPMLAEVGAMPGFKLFGGGRRRNPLVSLPVESEAALGEVTHVLVTHEHPDHFDTAGLRWVRERGLPVYTNGIDAPNLRKKGLVVHELSEGSLGMSVEVVRSRHGSGLLGWLMGPVAGYFLAYPGEPSLYVIGDSVMTESVLEAVSRLRPDVILAPAGAANMGLGGNILFSEEELVQLCRATEGVVVFNHLEALDHCPTTRVGLRERMKAEGLSDRTFVPEDGETLTFEAPSARDRIATMPRGERPGFQKWFTAPFAGT